MTERTYYDSSNGQIITSVRGDIEYLDLSEYEQYPYIDGFGDSSKQYVDAGLLCDMPPKPNPDSVFNFNEKKWEDPSIDVIETKVKIQRDAALLACDWTQLPDVPLANKQAWAVYRQELRDITKQSGYPFNVVWPNQPE